MSNGDEAIIFDKGVTTIFDLWDLPMIGCETFDVIQALQQKISGPDVELTRLVGRDCKLNCVTAHAFIPYAGGYHEQRNERERLGPA
jgi:hypothetical protein